MAGALLPFFFPVFPTERLHRLFCVVLCGRAVKMLSRSPASTVSRPCSRELLHAIAHNVPQLSSRQLRRGAANPIRQRSRNCSSLRNQCPLPPQFPSKKRATDNRSGVWCAAKRSTSTSAPVDGAVGPSRKDEIYALIDNINQHDAELAELLENLDLLDEHHGVLNIHGTDLDHAFSQTIGHRSPEALESRVRMARQQFGESLPEGYLNAVETQLYVRLYGEPIVKEQELQVEDEEAGADSDQLFREDGQGGWEEVEFERATLQGEGEEEIPVVYDMEAGPEEEESMIMKRAREVAEQLGGEVMLQQFEDEAVPDSTPRRHPLTVEGKFSTNPSTILLPTDTVVGPISAILSNYSNKHLKDKARAIFGGRSLPHSTTVMPPRAQLPQLPVALEASQHYMSDMEANSFLAVLYPGIYSSVLSILVEIRKRLGTSWIRRLMTQEGGPSVLDAGGGGAGILAWRDILRTEHELMNPDSHESDSVPMGKSTVVTGSEALRLRAAAMLENTTFLPRLPDYVHVRDTPTLEDAREPPKRKQYDIIIAPHTLLGIEDDYLRKEHVENLWSLLNPNGGVLILLEKGRQRGFEAVAGAREMLLKRHISSPGSTEYEDFLESPGDGKPVKKETGMIIAPCTNHEICPMYRFPGVSKGREDYCHFQQRYIRPQFLQRIIDAKDRNHEDVKFSYIAVQRGEDLRQQAEIAQDIEATNAAFAGYEHIARSPKEEELEAVNTPNTTETTPQTTEATPSESPTGTFHTLSLPRIVYPPMKRRGHVILDVCTPEAKIERWIVPRSFSKTAFTDARKAGWGDLWALGAKTRIPRTLVLGQKDGEGKKERLARRAAVRAALREEQEELSEGNTSSTPPLPEMPILIKEKGQTIPSWKKKLTKKQTRQAAKKRSAAGLESVKADV